MKITRAAAETMLDELGFHTVKNWDDDRVAEKLNKLDKLLDGTETLDTDEAKKNLKKVQAALEEKEKIVLLTEDKDDEKPAKKKDADEDDEKPKSKKDADDDDEKPAKKKDADEDDEKPKGKSKKDADDEDEKPAKAKSGKRTKGPSQAQAINDALGEPKEYSTFEQILKRAKKVHPDINEGRVRTHLAHLVNKAKVAKHDADKGWALLKAI